MPAWPVVRDSEFRPLAPPIVLSLSRLTVVPPTVIVVLAKPAGSLNRLPFAVPVRSPEKVVVSARSVGKVAFSRSV